MIQNVKLLFPKVPEVYYLKFKKKKIKSGVVLGQIMGQIMSNVVKKVKQAISLSFFHILLGDYLLKQEAVVAKPPE